MASDFGAPPPPSRAAAKLEVTSFEGPVSGGGGLPLEHLQHHHLLPLQALQHPQLHHPLDDSATLQTLTPMSTPGQMPVNDVYVQAHE
ncbi:Hypothetical predicted protein, partial [Cloeon dipterum]